MDKNLSFKFTVTYSVDNENLACEDMSMKVKIAGINYHLDKMTVIILGCWLAILKTSLIIRLIHLLSVSMQMMGSLLVIFQRLKLLKSTSLRRVK